MKANERFFNINNDFRNPYARDRDRIIHCGSFRKLEYKTQVFLNQEGDFFRTRLTHSIEVSQIARSISSNLGLEESLAEAIALAHDLGHTPFGHVGGDTLDECLKNDNHKNGFEHNFQSFRVLTKLEKRYREFDGLNLTYATLEGVLKHSYPYKKSFLPQEVTKNFALDTHPSIEAMVVDRADEIAYMSHDIDDGVNSGLITFDDLKESSIISLVLDQVHSEGIELEEDEMFRYRFSSHFINHLVYSLLDYSKEKVETQGVLAKTVDASKEIPIGYSNTLETEIKKLKKLLYKKMYHHHQIVRKMYSGSQAIKGLYEAMDSEIKILPPYFKALLDKREQHRVISDYIASMSDRYAIKLYNELYGRVWHKYLIKFFVMSS